MTPKTIDQKIRRILQATNKGSKITKKGGQWFIDNKRVLPKQMQQLSLKREVEVRMRRFHNLETATFIKNVKNQGFTKEQLQLIKEIRREESRNLKLPRLRLDTLTPDKIDISKLKNRLLRARDVAFENSVKAVLSLFAGAATKQGYQLVSPDLKAFLDREIKNFDQKLIELSGTTVSETDLTNLRDAMYKNQWETVINLFEAIYEKYVQAQIQENKGSSKQR